MEITSKISDLLAKAQNVDDGVQSVVDYLGETLHVSRVYVFETTDDGVYINNTYEWCAPGIMPMIDRLQFMSVKKYGYDVFFADTDMFNCPDIEGPIPEATREELRSQGIRATVQCAIFEHGTFRGFIGVDDCSGVRDDWRAESKESRQLRYVSRLLSLYLIKERNLGKMRNAYAEAYESNLRLAVERAQYQKALTTNALYTINFDVTEGMLTEEITDRNGKNRLEALGLTTPCFYDAYIRTSREHYQIELLDEKEAWFFTREGILERFKQGVTTESIEYYMRETDTYMRLLALLAEYEPGGHTFATFICFDVTETRKAELEKQMILKDALAQAEHANKAKTMFLNNMSHDIRTPMNAIIGFTALASTHVNSPDKVLEYLKKIQTSSNHLLSLINDVLDMSRIESGKVKIEEARISLADVMHDLKSIVQADVHAKQLELFFDTVDVEDENVWCDKLRLNQVLLNCMSNAIKFTPSGGTIGMKVIQLPCRKEGYAQYEFKIKDTGIGMSPEFVQHIFEPFEREKTSTVSGIQGTGLGMSITKNIVDMMGGKISVASEKGKGSEFTISISLRLASAPEHNYAVPELQSVHALVADDNFDTCTSVVAMLKKIGLRPEWTVSGKEAVLRAQVAVSNNDPFGVYIIDWLMPDLNGVEVVRRIRSQVDDKTPIIILTAYDWSDIEEEAREAGVTAFCSKPLFLSELSTLLGRTASEQEPAETPKEETEQDLKDIRILLVEDNEMNREIAQEILGGLGADVDTAEDGSIAVERVASQRPDRYDVILMDVQMPVMNGYDATRRIRSMSQLYAHIPIIAMTANAFEEDRKAALESGMNGYIAKPIDIRSVADKIRMVLKNDAMQQL